jgi:hypothetical protein
MMTRTILSPQFKGLSLLNRLLAAGLCVYAHAATAGNWLTTQDSGCLVWYGDAPATEAAVAPNNNGVIASWNAVCKRGKPITGKGVLTLKAADALILSYSGDLLQGKAAGKGQETRIEEGDETLSDGIWQDGQLLKGQISNSTGEVYRGNFEYDGERNNLVGEVELQTLHDENWGHASYQGGYQNDARNGFGMMEYKNHSFAALTTDAAVELNFFKAKRIGRQHKQHYRVSGIWADNVLLRECSDVADCAAQQAAAPAITP